MAADVVNVFDSDLNAVMMPGYRLCRLSGRHPGEDRLREGGNLQARQVAICADDDVPKALRAQARETGATLWSIGIDFGFRSHQSQWDYRGRNGVRNALPDARFARCFSAE